MSYRRSPAARSRSRSRSRSPRRHSRSPSPRYRGRSPSPRGYRGRSPGGYRRGGGGGGGGGGGRGPGVRRGYSPRGGFGSERDKQSSTALFIGNLPYHYREREVGELFERCGRIKNVTVGLNRRTGQSKGYSFVTFDDRRDAEDAFDRYNGYEIEGRRLRLDWDVGMDKKQDLFKSQPRVDRGGRGGRSPRRSGSPRSPRSPSPRGRSNSPRGRSPSPRPNGDGPAVDRKGSRSPPPPRSPTDKI